MAAGLTEKQRRFCEEYLIDLNATRAYMAAYPSTKKESTAAKSASRMLRNGKVQKFLEEQKRERQKRTEISQDEVLKAIRDIAFDNKVKEKDRLKALEMLCKHLGIFDPHKDELDRREQEARIAKLEREAASTEESREIKVNILGMDVSELAEVIG